MQKQIDEINNILGLTTSGRLPWESVGHEFKAQNGDNYLVLYVYPGETQAEKLNTLFPDGKIGCIPSYLVEVDPDKSEESIIAETTDSPLYKPLEKLQNAVIDSIFQRYATPFIPLESNETVQYLFKLQNSGLIGHDNEAMTAISALRDKGTNISKAFSALTTHQKLKLQETLYRYTIETCPDCGHPIQLNDMLETIQSGICPTCHRRLESTNAQLKGMNT